MADHLRTELVVDALDIAIWRRRPTAGLMHHSDQGNVVYDVSDQLLAALTAAYEEAATGQLTTYQGETWMLDSPEGV